MSTDDETETPPITNAEIAAKITGHLKRFEADVAGVNRKRRYDEKIRGWVDDEDRGWRPYNGAHATVVSGRIHMVFAWNASARCTRDEAKRYLAWLDAGNVGRPGGIPSEFKFEDDEIKCAGCNTPLGKRSEEYRSGHGYGHAYIQLYSGGPDNVWVCRARNKGSKTPKDSCALKARQRVCPGCGEPTKHGRLCFECEKQLAYAAKRKEEETATEGQKLVETAWSTRGLVITRWESAARQMAEKRFGELFVSLVSLGAPVSYGHAVGPHKPSKVSPGFNNTDHAHHTLTIGPRVAIAQELLDLMYDLVEGTYAAGYGDGENALLKMAEGRLSMTDFNEASAKVAERLKR